MPKLALANGIKVALADVSPDEALAPVTDALAVSLGMDASDLKYLVVAVSSDHVGEVRKYLWRGDEAHLKAT